MTDLPEPVTREWLAHQLAEIGDGLDCLQTSLGALIEIVSRIEANTTAFRDEVRAFNQEERQRERLRGRDA
jgi:hypothetical protein